MTLGEAIKATRERSRGTQAALAASAGVAVVTIQKVESGARAPSLSVLRRIAKALGVRVSELFVMTEGG